MLSPAPSAEPSRTQVVFQLCETAESLPGASHASYSDTDKYAQKARCRCNFAGAPVCLPGRNFLPCFKHIPTSPGLAHAGGSLFSRFARQRVVRRRAAEKRPGGRAGESSDLGAGGSRGPGTGLGGIPSEAWQQPWDPPAVEEGATCRGSLPAWACSELCGVRADRGWGK